MVLGTRQLDCNVDHRERFWTTVPSNKQTSETNCKQENFKLVFEPRIMKAPTWIIDAKSWTRVIVCSAGKNPRYLIHGNAGMESVATETLRQTQGSATSVKLFHKTSKPAGRLELEANQNAHISFAGSSWRSSSSELSNNFGLLRLNKGISIKMHQSTSVFQNKVTENVNIVTSKLGKKLQ